MTEGRIGFIGAGNIASALMRGLVVSGRFPAQRIICSDVDEQKLQSLGMGLGVYTTKDNTAVPPKSDIVVLAVKPSMAPQVAFDIAPMMAGKGLVSLCAGITTLQLRNMFGPETRILRSIPNTPAMAGEGMTALSLQHDLTPEQLELVNTIFESIGKTAWVADDAIDAVTALSASGPAYVYMFIEALANAGVREGLPQELAFRLAAQTVKGAAQMALTTGKHPASLISDVLSPGGTTVEALYELEEKGLRAAVMSAVRAAARRAAELGHKA